jgi:deazaflavin-dependent oxidoreductase (nitroreductase family)
VRRLVFGPEEQFFRYLGFHSAAYIFDDAEIHGCLKNRFCLTDSTNRLMGLYGLRDGRVATFCVHRTADPTLPVDPRATLRDIYASLGWVVPRAVEKCPPNSELYYDQVAQVEVPEWSRGRVVLVGDACQAVSLLAGQGASLAVAGAYVMGEQLAGGDSIETALAHYERVWRPIVEEKQRVGRRGTQWFLPRTSRELWARRLMFALGALPLVDRYLGAQLVGKSNIRVQDLAQPGPAAWSSRGPTQTTTESDGAGNTRALFARSSSPWLRALFKAPVWLYRAHLGGLLGDRFILLIHRGRKSGHLYRTALEVVHYDPRTRESIVCSGWGTRADWYRNITAGQPVAVETRGHRYDNPSFRTLQPDENYWIVDDYMRRMPSVARPLAHRLGLVVPGPEDARRAHSRRLLMVAFRPRPAGTPSVKPEQVENGPQWADREIPVSSGDPRRVR